MRLIASRLALAALTAVSVGCDPSSSSSTASGDGASTPAEAHQSASDETKASLDAAHQEAQLQRLSMRLAALDFFSEQMWPDHESDAALDWLKSSAQTAGVEVDRVMPELIIERAGVAVRPVKLQAVGDWADLVTWMQDIETSPRRLILREVKLQTLRNRVIAELKLAVMIDRPTGVSELAKLDVASLEGEALDHAVDLIEAELQGKSRAFTELGADASWSRPIADLTQLMPASSRPVTLSVGRYANGERAQQYTGTFTLLIPDAGQVPTYVRRIQKHQGFAEAGLRSLRQAGAEWQRVTVTFTFAGDGVSADPTASDLATVPTEAP